jgi:hypothetical protein
MAGRPLLRARRLRSVDSKRWAALVSTETLGNRQRRRCRRHLVAVWVSLVPSYPRQPLPRLG